MIYGFHVSIPVLQPIDPLPFCLPACVRPGMNLTPVKGMPLFNALASVLRTNRQLVSAVFSSPVFLGDQGLLGGGQ